MRDHDWYYLALGFLGVFAVVAGACAADMADLISAIASRIRYGKLPHPEQRPKEGP